LPLLAGGFILPDVMDVGTVEPLIALLAFLALTAAAHPAAARLDALASASPSRLAAALSFALRVTALTTALAGMHGVRAASTAAERWRQFRRWAVIVGVGGGFAWAATFLVG
jgi:hypothetical protein